MITYKDINSYLDIFLKRLCYSLIKNQPIKIFTFKTNMEIIIDMDEKFSIS
jgi:hypothetical protein